MSDRNKKKVGNVKPLVSVFKDPEGRKKLFLQRIKDGATIFSEMLSKSNGNVVVLAHNDVDGVVSASLFALFLRKYEYKSIIRFLDGLNYSIVEDIKRDFQDLNPVFVFLDLGSSLSKTIKSELENVIILDHHILDHKELINDKFHINPFLFNIDGDKEITTGVLTYFFLKNFLKEIEKVSSISLISVKGDRQDFVSFNGEVLKDAMEFGLVKCRKTWKLYGRYSKPIHIALSTSPNVYIEDISGNLSAAVELLSFLDISIENKEGKKRTLEDLTEEERKKLLNELIKRGCDISEVFGDVYELTYDFNGEDGLRDLDEISTLVNSACKLGYPSVALGFLIGDNTSTKIIKGIYEEYKKKIFSTLKEIFNNYVKYVEVKDEYLTIVRLGKLVDEKLLSVIISIIKNKFESKVVAGYTFSSNGLIKFSFRSRDPSINLAKVVRSCVSKVKGEGGGHREAAGAYIKKDYLEDFVEIFLSELKKSYKS